MLELVIKIHAKQESLIAPPIYGNFARENATATSCPLANTWLVERLDKGLKMVYANFVNQLFRTNHCYHLFDIYFKIIKDFTKDIFD